MRAEGPLTETDTVDPRIVERAQEGDLDAYELLVARYTAVAFRTAVLLGAGSDAEDVIQEAFVKAYRNLRRYRGDSTFRAWLLAIVANETRNLHRSRSRRTGLLLRFAATEPRTDRDESAETDALAWERREQIVAALRGMDVRDRDVLTCRFLLDLSEEETATTLGWPRGTVKSRTSRALARLRLLLGETEVEHG